MNPSLLSRPTSKGMWCIVREAWHRPHIPPPNVQSKGRGAERPLVLLLNTAGVIIFIGSLPDACFPSVIGNAEANSEQ